jgi:tRNA-specific 2-thiouridylase
VIVGLSGGVDSAVTAALLREEGFEVVGVALHTWRSPNLETTGDPLEGARAVAHALEVPLHVVDVRERFYREVVERFADDYARGLTPNPCVLCNPDLKFHALLQYADKVGAAWLATGHYARVERLRDGTARLLRAHSPQRDQSYVLYRLPQSVLQRLRLPLGYVEDKDFVREMARRLELPAAEAPDSQDLCFLAGGDYRDLLRRRRPASLRPGPIVTREGEVLGEHEGVPLYTVGQRSGLRIAAGERLYVLELRPEENALVVGPFEALLQRSCELTRVTFVRDVPAQSLAAEVKVRYRATPVPATVDLQGGGEARVTFAEAQRALAPGQSVVFYDGEEVLGGGIIVKR